jgi:SAM-dependent methyltransferase
MLERRLADRLKLAPRRERTSVYSEVYRELFDSLPDHPQKSAKSDGRTESILQQLALLKPHLSATSRFLEVGCGDAALTFAVATRAQHAYGLDVTDALIDRTTPPNFEFLITTGVDIPLPDRSVDVSYSNQLIEHLHPNDAALQLREVWRVLSYGGVYRCVTPSRFTGPHDISRYFDYEATGLHLKEYDYKDLRQLFRDAGFRSTLFYVTGGHRQVRIPYFVGRAAEIALSMLPKSTSAFVASLPFVNQLMGLTIVGVKAHDAS